jgi:hypothetical protein
LYLIPFYCSREYKPPLPLQKSIILDIMTSTLDFEYVHPQREYPNIYEATTTAEVVGELVDELDAFLELMMSTLSLSTGSSVENLQAEIDQLEVDEVVGGGISRRYCKSYKRCS